MPVTPRIEVEAYESGVVIVRFLERKISDERMVREIADQLFAAVPSNGKAIRVILDFTGVELLSSSMLGKLIVLQRRVDASGGKMRLCEMTPTTLTVFKTSSLDRLFGIDRDRREALEKV